MKKIMIPNGINFSMICVFVSINIVQYIQTTKFI